MKVYLSKESKMTEQKSAFEKELEDIENINALELIIKAKNKVKKKILDEIDIQMEYNKPIQPLMNSGLRQAKKIIEEKL